MAYVALATKYGNLNENQLFDENLTKAFELRERVSERERFSITSRYYGWVTGELDKAIETYNLWIQAYPRDDVAHTNLGIVYDQIGQFEKALDEGLEALRLQPDRSISYSNVASFYLDLNRPAEAKAILAQALAKKFDTYYVHQPLYLIAFAEGDAEGMRRYATWAAGRPEEPFALFDQAQTEAYYGKLRKARELYRRATEMAAHADLKENAAWFLASESMVEALFGNIPQAREQVAKAMAMARTRWATLGEAMAMAMLGDVPQGEALAQDAAKRFPTALITEAVRVGPEPAFHHPLHGRFDLRLVRITALDHPGGDAVRAEKQVNVGGHARGVAVGAPKTYEALLDALHQRVEVDGIIVEIAHHMYRRRLLAWKLALPLVQAAARGGGRILGIERQQDNLLGGESRKFANRRFRQRMPITHGHHHARRERFAEFQLQRPRLPRRHLANG